MSDGATPSPHTNMIRNIIVGVTTTILGSTAVYFLGFHNKGDSPSKQHDYLEVKEATTNAWRSYVTLENIEYKNALTLNESIKNMTSVDDMKNELSKESNKFTGDVETLLKNNDIDDAFVSLLKRRLDAEKEAITAWDTFFDECKNIQNTTTVGQERNQKANAALTKLQTSGDIILKRTKTEITDLAKSLNEKYGQQFSTSDLLLFKENNTPEKNDGSKETTINNPPVNPVNTNQTAARNNFVGEWDYQVGAIRFNNDGSMYMQGNNGQAVSGSWQYANNQIGITYPNEYGVSMTYVYNLFYVTANSFTMQFSSNPNIVYNLQRRVSNY